MAGVEFELRGCEGGLIKQLSGFNKQRHTIPSAATDAAQQFLGKICVGELEEAAEEFYQEVKKTFGLKRRELELTTSSPHAILRCEHFQFELSYRLDEEALNAYCIEFALSKITPIDLLNEPELNHVFANHFDLMRLHLQKPIQVEDLIDEIEEGTCDSTLHVEYPSHCRHCTIHFPKTMAKVNCYPHYLEIESPSMTQPSGLMTVFGELRDHFSEDGALAIVF